MHALDPVGTRELIKQALEAGSKEVKVVAIECLGSEKEDLAFLTEQTTAKSQEVRQAAYRALASINDDAAVTVLQKAMIGTELEVAASSLSRSRNAKLLKFIIAGADQEIANLAAMTDKKEIGQKIRRIATLLGCLFGRDDHDTEAFLLKLFGVRDELAQINGTDFSGADLNHHVVVAMQQASTKVKKTLAEAHAFLNPHDMSIAFIAAREALPVDKVFAMFSPYVVGVAIEEGKGAKTKGKRKNKDDASARREVICEAISAQGTFYYGWRRDGGRSKHDPRWLDVAVDLRHVSMVEALARPGHTGAMSFLKNTFDELLKKSKTLDDCHQILAAMVYSSHPEATDAFLACLEKFAKKKGSYYDFWFGHFIPGLPKSAIPRIEAIVPELPDNVADNIIGYLQQLRDKK